MKRTLTTVALTAVVAACASSITGPNSEAIKEVERMNQGVFSKRAAHFQAPDALLFVALDPVWSTPDFDNVPFRHPQDMRMIKDAYRDILKQGVEEVVVWKFKRGGMGSAIAFKEGTTVKGYGEPDSFTKLMSMQDTLKTIRRNGIDDPSVRDSLKKLLMASRFESNFDVTMIDAMIRRIRPIADAAE